MSWTGLIRFTQVHCDLLMHVNESCEVRGQRSEWGQRSVKRHDELQTHTHTQRRTDECSTHSLWGSAGATAGCRPCSCWSDAGRRLWSSCRAPSHRCCGRGTHPPRAARTPSRPIPATDARDPPTTDWDLQNKVTHTFYSFDLILLK